MPVEGRVYQAADLATYVKADLLDVLDKKIRAAKHDKTHALTNMGFWRAHGVLNALQDLRAELFGGPLVDA